MKYTFAMTLLALSVVSANVSAETAQSKLQMDAFSGAAGNTSTEPGTSPFTFNKFDDALGVLKNVFFRTTFTLSGGLIGADNMTNETTSGFGVLGAKLFLTGSEPLLNGSYASLFSPIEITQQAEFILQADPTLSTGGNGPDVATYYGQTLQEQTEWRAVSTVFLNNYTGAGQTFTINFDTDPIILVNVAGAQGFFQVPNVFLNVEMYYEYEPVANSTTPPADVNAPGALLFAGSAFGLLLASNRRKNKKVA